MPLIPLTLIVEGYGVLAPESGIATAVALVNDFVAATSAPTVNTNESLALFVPSLTNTVIVATPDWPFAGVTVTVRLEPLPPNTMLFVGASAGFDEDELNVRFATGVSASVRVNGNAAVGVFTAVD